MELFKYMLRFYPYKHIAMNRFPSNQANFSHVSMVLVLRLGGNNRTYAVCIHIYLTTHLGNKRIGKFLFTFGFTKPQLSNWDLLNVVIQTGMLVKLTNKSMLYTQRFKQHVTSNWFCLPIYIYIYICLFIYLNKYIYLYVLSMYMFYVCVWVCVCVCVCVCMCVCVEVTNKNINIPIVFLPHEFQTRFLNTEETIFLRCLGTCWEETFSVTPDKP